MHVVKNDEMFKILPMLLLTHLAQMESKILEQHPVAYSTA